MKRSASPLNSQIKQDKIWLKLSLWEPSNGHADPGEENQAAFCSVIQGTEF